ncbi:helix-turn-helix transcriptional regulator [Leptolyngbya sp. FACHB-711]|jgi:transcriptional regulator with XRE-family HTH domain|uniref:helix-turn-helix domain-containing protein n=1 Tax=unclassified Leptolyngbya TaxID=2650499 RepID=UPI001688E76F|nr:helix-turn-helix transcriptional regulator [Leptolyngbya sp. FACHB-711]MBD1849168.1 helix-turn-helix transcriptional regulator [Cyanobacteria bacterium FACHB-502]MBD2026683.1 helix-turn-helix transcriptional regulator [Leptolyngbya sp. FACHB-711]
MKSQFLQSTTVEGAQVVLPGLIRQTRQCLGLTQTQFAAKLGVSFLSVNRWENGHHQPLPIVLKQIEALLHEMGAEGQDLLKQYYARIAGLNISD